MASAPLQRFFEFSPVGDFSASLSSNTISGNSRLPPTRCTIAEVDFLKSSGAQPHFLNMSQPFAEKPKQTLELPSVGVGFLLR
jgi:hypothetical protein